MKTYIPVLECKTTVMLVIMTMTMTVTVTMVIAGVQHPTSNFSYIRTDSLPVHCFCQS